MYRNLLLPVVFDEGYDTQASFLVARQLADEGASITVMHVVEAIPAYVAAQMPKDLLTTSQAEMKKNLDIAARGIPGAKTALVHGHAGRTIVEYARDHSVDCIILASHLPGLENYLLGSTADRVVRHAPCSVHVIR